MEFLSRKKHSPPFPGRPTVQCSRDVRWDLLNGTSLQSILCVAQATFRESRFGVSIIDDLIPSLESWWTFGLRPSSCPHGFSKTRTADVLLRCVWQWPAAPSAFDICWRTALALLSQPACSAVKCHLLITVDHQIHMSRCRRCHELH